RVGGGGASVHAATTAASGDVRECAWTSRSPARGGKAVARLAFFASYGLDLDYPLIFPSSTNRRCVMPAPEQIKKFIGMLGSNPRLIEELGTARNPHDVRGLLVKHNVIGPNDQPFSRAEVTKEVINLLRSGQAPRPPQAGERTVEWVAAIG